MLGRALEIIGVVTPLGPVGYGEEADLWTLGVSLRPWRNAAGLLVQEEIFLTKRGLQRSELDRLQASLPEWGLVRVRVAGDPHRRQYDSGLRRWEGGLLEVLDRAAADEDLAAWVEHQCQPVIIHDAFFGTLQLDRRVNAYDGRRSLATGSYELSIERATDDDDSARDEGAIKHARSSFERLEGDLPRYVAAAADELLSIYNENWREEEEPVLGREEFIQALQLTSVRLGPSGAMYVYLNPGELFAGHWIELRAEAFGELTSVGLSG